ncbi:e8fd80f6-715d-48da-bd18-63d5428cde73 [Thermothielavioides terrestris]|uniref:E8fd80f6-715d-48da-bd18-63d5428cde73 n=1 Tax=Thermothielavioides terrestris TaxID=2587410 RepID=A0A3S4AHZ8_9PEZI|nr:e8fd80f6-715d-48da-bd18-63d5428cde73 [Thermothielavioides terrestris]
MAATDSRKTVRIGVFIPADCQLLDMACIDIFGTMSYEYFSLVKGLVPAPMLNLAPSVQISCTSDPQDISTIQPGELIPLTASARVSCTHHLSHPAVQPGQLDIVLVPGPDPTIDWTDGDKKAALEWLAAHAARPETDILCVCTGIYLCGAAGLLKGKKACGPRALQGDLAKKFEGWRGITNGNDLVAAYARLSGRFPGPVAELALVMTETGERPQRYERGKSALTLGILWQVLKAVWMGYGKKKTA